MIDFVAAANRVLVVTTVADAHWSVQPPQRNTTIPLRPYPLFNFKGSLLTERETRLEKMERYEKLDLTDVEERCKIFRVEPVTPLETLKQRNRLHRMELLCMNIQNDFIQNIERIESSGNILFTHAYAHPEPI